MKYACIIFLQDDNYNELEKVLYPEREGGSLGWPDEAKGMEYLAQWDHGEATEDEVFEGTPSGKDLTEYPFCFQGNDQSYETEEYVMVWSAGYSVAGLWRKISE